MMLEKNLAAIAKKYPNLPALIRQSAQGLAFEVIDTKNHSKTIKIADGEQFFLIHSKYNPEKEAERLLKDLDLSGVNSIIVIGFGLGYHLLQLFDRIKKTGIKLFIIVTKPELFKESLKYNDFTDLISAETVYLYLQNEIDRNELRDFIISRVDQVYENIRFFLLPAFKRYDTLNCKLILTEINHIVKVIKLNRTTILERGCTWEENALMNLSLFLKNRGIQPLKGMLRNQPVIIVSAGPSLNKNINHLKGIKGKAVVIAIDAVIKKLLAKDIIPDFVMVLDGYKYTLRHFEGLDYSKFKDTILVGVPQFFHKIFAEWPGPVVFAPTYGMTEKLINWVENLSNFKGRIRIGGSVAHFAFGFAYHLGANPIVLTGQDLAFTDGFTHSDGVDYSARVEDLDKNNIKYFQIEDIHGDRVWTQLQLYQYLQWFNREIRGIRQQNRNIKFINATEGGAKIEGTEVMSLQNVITKYCQKKTKVAEKIKNKIISFRSVYAQDRVINSVQELITNLNQLKALSQNALHLLTKNSDNDVILELKEINNQIYKIKDKVMLYESAIYLLSLAGPENNLDLHAIYQALSGSSHFTSILENILDDL
ncbi:MAG: DUF115 domain-containing protein [Halanaerobiales bacterium]|nr:DUF115 domain-containing protein [Halanaerobiales bacterium]